MTNTIYAIVWRDYDIHLAQETVYTSREAADRALTFMRLESQRQQTIAQLMSQDMEIWRDEQEKIHERLYGEYQAAQYLSEFIRQSYKEQHELSERYYEQRLAHHESTVPMPVELDPEWDMSFITKLTLI